MEPSRPGVVIIGAGFGGLSAAKALAHAPVDVTVVDRQNYHLFQPLLYQVATGELPLTDVAAPLRSVLSRHKNTRVVLGEVSQIDLDRRLVVTDVGELPYDFLIVATGDEPNYYGEDSWEALAPSPKGLDAALEIRRRVLTAIERAETVEDPVEQRRLLQFIVVGGGSTGVEFAGALGELAKAGFSNALRRIDPSLARVHIVEGGPRILPAYPEDLAKKAEDQLARLGVVIHAGKRATGIDRNGATLDDGTRIEASTVIWTAGVRPTALAAALPGEHLDGRVVVAPDLSLPGRPEVFAIGDMAHVEHDGAPLPAVSPVAIQQGRAAAHAVVRSVHHEAREPFRYVDKGTLATVGRRRAVGVVGRLHLSGIIPWLLIGVVHLAYLAGVRNRLHVTFTWLWTLLSGTRGSPIITGARAVPPAGGQVQKSLI